MHDILITVLTKLFRPPLVFSIYLSRLITRDPCDGYDAGSCVDLVQQDLPDYVIKEPSHEVPMVGRASTIFCFGPVGTGF
jgi:hypothetical protein